MLPAEFRAARARLGLSQAGLAEALRLGPNGERTIRRWEQGDVPVAGPASLAIELVLATKKIAEEAAFANNVIAHNRDGQGSGRVKVATAMHRIAALANPSRRS